MIANAAMGEATEEQKTNKALQHVKYINLYVQLPNETMSELVREYTAHFFDKTMFSKNRHGMNAAEAEEGEMQRKVEEELNLTLNPTSLLDQPNSAILKKATPTGQKAGQDSILSSSRDNRSATADFLVVPGGSSAAVKSPYQQQAGQPGGQVSPTMNRGNGPANKNQQTEVSPHDLCFKLGEVMAFLKR